MTRRPNTTPQAPRLERKRSVIARTGRSESSIYRDVIAGTFPAPVKIGPRAVAWNADDVDAWIAACLSGADKGKASAT